MKTYTITVNGKVYDVTVEEKEPDETPSPTAETDAPQSDAAKVGSKAPAETAKQSAPTAPAGKAGPVSIEAGAAGKIVDILAEPGTAVSRGDTILILEVMKMETPVVAPEDGTIASVEVTKGQSVAAGALLATMN